MKTTALLLSLAASVQAFDAVSHRRLMNAQIGKEVVAAAPIAPELPAKLAAFAIPGDGADKDADKDDQNEDGDSNNGDESQGKEGDDKDAAEEKPKKEKDQYGADITKTRFGPFCFDQKVSHFDEGEKRTFCQRYWVDSQYYVEGGPVFILDGGETDGANRADDSIPFMEQGILQILSNATGGMSVILEHRYYGASYVTEDLSTDNLRWLNNKESLEDSAEFIRKFPVPKDVQKKLKNKDVFKPDCTPYIYYGGSYAGARAAFMRKEYPDLVFGGIGSSGVTHAQVYYPEYFDPIITYGEPACIKAMEESIASVDELLDKSAETNAALKKLFGLEALNDVDFAGVLQYPTGGWQGQNWDPAVGSTDWADWCRALTVPRSNADATVAGMSVPGSLLNYADYVRDEIIKPSCPSGDIQGCFAEGPDSDYQNTSLSQTWRLWQFQVCTQWGYFQVAPKPGKRTIVSRKLTLDTAHKICKQAYPPGEHFSVPAWPDVHETNSRGSYYIAYDRLAFIDGEIDPWRPVTPNADVAPKRNSTTSPPNWIIPGGVHHYDENGLKDHLKEPKQIQEVHAFMVDFVHKWLEGKDDEGHGHGNGHGHGHGNGNGNGHGHGNGHDNGNHDGWENGKGHDKDHGNGHGNHDHGDHGN
ncbi:hypothetical protein A1Q1_00498 [Trichosporon asahii var. asahii CBS 2479]|uniref:Serine carboxypeptidase n=1 Tax=Trichosporon asahii var. asahii (strain ATCC 90039 / CBS 2479 / JCM 2466 / KCTC 7840 / NBRC 103889/ NCYC 2677 / UAMH 7654) TaxID=1186058 RepID=J6F4L0_TRIAS|nr:hypothetical protein A1Q1_00498 [Trichosporon asahii var. asahii CBS 2479]EJT50197.1 hypothetical protein A1Q1_00498 [Trichosporon asahii var. asahii CBS 2479]